MVSLKVNINKLTLYIVHTDIFNFQINVILIFYTFYRQCFAYGNFYETFALAIALPISPVEKISALRLLHQSASILR